jgi:hypothetical protein
MNNQELIDNNNQLDNVSNMKGLPGSQGNTTTGRNDHRQTGATNAHVNGIKEDGVDDKVIAAPRDRIDGGIDDTGRESNDAAGGYPRSPGGANQLAADRKMDDDTGLSNTANQPRPIDEGSKQAEQSNVGRRDDMTAD